MFKDAEGEYVLVINDTDVDLSVQVHTNGSFQDLGYFELKKKAEGPKKDRDSWWRLVDPTLEVDIKVNGLFVGTRPLGRHSEITEIIKCGFLKKQKVFKLSQILGDIYQSIRDDSQLQISTVEANNSLDSLYGDDEMKAVDALKKYLNVSVSVFPPDIANNNTSHSHSHKAELEQVKKYLKSMENENKNFVRPFLYRGKRYHLVKFLSTFGVYFSLSDPLNKPPSSAAKPQSAWEKFKKQLFDESSSAGTDWRCIQILPQFKLQQLEMVLDNIASPNFVEPHFSYYDIFQEVLGTESTGKRKSQRNFTNEVDTEFNVVSVDEIMKSTNEYLVNGHNHPSYRFWASVSIMVIVLQIVILSIIVADNYSISKVGAFRGDLVVVRVFVALYMALLLLNNISDTTFDIFESVSDSDYKFARQLVMLIFIPVIAFAWLLSFPPRWDKILLVLLDYLLVFTGIFGSLLVVKQQVDIVSTVFNFSGLLIVLAFDDAIADAFKRKARSDQLFRASYKAKVNKDYVVAVAIIIVTLSIAYLLS